MYLAQLVSVVSQLAPELSVTWYEYDLAAGAETSVVLWLGFEGSIKAPVSRLFMLVLNQLALFISARDG